MKGQERDNEGTKKGQRKKLMFSRFYRHNTIQKQVTTLCLYVLTHVPFYVPFADKGMIKVYVELGT